LGIGIEFAGHNRRRRQGAVVVVFCSSLGNDLLNIETRLAGPNWFDLGGFEEKNVVALGQRALLFEPFAKRQQQAAQNGNVANHAILPILAVNAQLLRPAQRPGKERALEWIPQALAALRGQLHARLSQAAVVGQWIGLADGPQVSAHQTQDIVGRFGPPGIGQFDFAAAVVAVFNHESGPSSEEFPTLFGLF
jgi:hypothetical protein